MTGVSVIVPVFNGAGVIGRTLTSVIAQTRTDFEIILVDDASTDGTAEAAAAFGDSRLRILRHDRNLGPAAARNTGIRAARSQFIAFLDANDEWLPQKLAIQIAAMEQEPRLGATSTAFYLYRSDRRVLRLPQAPHGWGTALLDGCYVSPGSTLMARKDCFAETGLLDESLRRFEDWEWLLRLVEGQRWAFDCLPQALAVIRAGWSTSYGAVEAAGARFYSLSAERVARMAGKSGQRRLKASIAIENAVAAAYDGNRLAVLCHLMHAGFISPSRMLRFISRTADKIYQRDW